MWCEADKSKLQDKAICRFCFVNELSVHFDTWKAWSEMETIDCFVKLNQETFKYSLYHVLDRMCHSHTASDWARVM